MNKIVGNDRPAALAWLDEKLAELEARRTFTLDAAECRLIDRIKQLRSERARIEADLNYLRRDS